MSNQKLINPHRLGNVFQLGFTKIVDSEIKPRFHLPVGIFGKAYCAGLSDALQSRRDIDPVTHQVAIAFLDNVAEMDADAKVDAPLRR